MGNRTRLSIILGMAAISGLGVAKAQETYVESIRPYNAALEWFCPEKRLENLTPGDFNTIIEDFLKTLPNADLDVWKQAAQPMCVDSVAGVSCANIAYVRAATKLRKIDDLAEAACHSKYVCSPEYGVCRTKP